ncbi:hypothetical protein F4802DRAFT_476146 [Xylaria palmicola]|nr:hypothetical protein F4802DRAFT_476146 [Xylaria palmicola]
MAKNREPGIRASLSCELTFRGERNRRLTLPLGDTGYSELGSNLLRVGVSHSRPPCAFLEATRFLLFTTGMMILLLYFRMGSCGGLIEEAECGSEGGDNSVLGLLKTQRSSRTVRWLSEQYRHPSRDSKQRGLPPRHTEASRTSVVDCSYYILYIHLK